MSVQFFSLKFLQPVPLGSDGPVFAKIVYGTVAPIEMIVQFFLAVIDKVQLGGLPYMYPTPSIPPTRGGK
jgi:hypothetical protein